MRPASSRECIEELPERGSRRRRRVLSLLAVAMLLLVGMWVPHTTGATLVWYETPPLGTHHRRIRCLAPPGWQVETDRRAAPYKVVIIRAPQPLRWLPVPVLRWFDRFTKNDAEVAIVWDETHWTSAAMDIEFTPRFRVDTRFGETTDGARWQFSYASPDVRFFDRTHTAICESLRVE